MKKLVAVWLVLGAAIGTVYANALHNKFVFDDVLLVVNRAEIPAVADNPWLIFSPGALGYRPLRTLSYVLDFWLGGMRPWIFHLNNLVYHWITACLVFLVALRLTNPERDSHPVWRATSTGALWRWQPALFVALLWALHPVQTESVTYISGRRDILTTLFFFLGFYAFLKYRAQPPAAPGRRHGWLALVLLSYVLGLLSKEMAVTLPLVMLGYDYVCEVRLAGTPYGWGYIKELGHGMCRAIWSRKYLYLPLFLGGIAFSGYIAFVKLPLWGVEWYGGSIGTNYLTTARIWVHYFLLLLYPQQLLADYSGAFPVTRSVSDPWALLAVAVLGLLFVGVLAALRYSRLVAFSGLWVGMTLLPVSHIIPYPEMMAEHYLYLPSFGFCLLVALGLARLTERTGFAVRDAGKWHWGTGTVSWRAVMGWALLISLLTFYAARTVSRNRDWRDDVTFYARLVADNPRSARARLGLGYVYDRSGLPRIAITHYLAGIRLDSTDPRLHTNLGAAYQKLGMLAEAEQAYKTSLQLRPRDSVTLNNLGFLHIEKGEFDKARSFLEQAEKLSHGGDAAVYANFGLLHEVQGHLSQAVAAYQKALALEPRNSVYAQKIEALEKQLAQQAQAATEAGQSQEPASP